MNIMNEVDIFRLFKRNSIKKGTKKGQTYGNQIIPRLFYFMWVKQHAQKAISLIDKYIPFTE